MVTMRCPRCGGTVRLTWEPPQLVIHASEHHCIPRGDGEPLPRAA